MSSKITEKSANVKELVQAIFLLVEKSQTLWNVSEYSSEAQATDTGLSTENTHE